MLIKNEISFDAINGQHNYGIIVMVIFYILSILICLLIGVVLVKLIITCLITDKYNHLFCVRPEDNDLKAGTENTRRISDNSIASNQLLNEEKFPKIENFFIKISETQIRTNQQCICPLCHNDHMSANSRNSSAMEDMSPTLKKGSSKRSSFIVKSAQVLSKKLVLKRDNKSRSESVSSNEDNSHENQRQVVIPIVSQTPKEKIVFKKFDRPLAEIKQIANYGDVVLELKQKFSSNTMINSIA